RMVQTVDHLPEHIGTVQFFMFLTAVLCTLPATLGMGVMFPLCVRVWSSGTGQTVGRDIGTLYAGNTLGSIVGAWLPGFVLMPTIGMEKTLHLSVALNLLVALALLIASATDEEEEKQAAGAKPDDKRKPTDGSWSLSRVLSVQAGTVYVLAPLIPAIAAALYYGTTRPSWGLNWDLSKMTLGVFRVSLASDVLDPERWGAPDLVYYHDGLSTTVTVERWGRHYALKNNGKVDASNGDDMPTQIMVAGFPISLHPSGGRNADIAVIGFGSGVTLGAALQFPVRKVDVIELEPSIMEASQFFRDVNHLTYGLSGYPYVNTPRLNVIADDGRNFLASTRNTYDIIISEPSNPWITGVSDLFTTDHFNIAKRRLRQGGIFAQWVQLYEMSPENIKTIYRTFASSFRYVVVFAAEDYSSDTVLLGSDSPIELDLARVRRAMQPPAVRQIMEAASVFTPHDVFARVLLTSRQEVMRYSTYVARRERSGPWEEIYTENGSEECEAQDCIRWGATLNTDDNAHIEFAAPRDLIGFQRYEGYLVQIYSPDWPYGRLDGVLRGVGTGDDAAREYAELAMSLIAHGRKLEAARFVERSSREGRARETAVALEVLRLLLTTENEPAARIEPPVPGPHLEAEMANQLLAGFERVQRSVDAGAWAQALSAMEEIPAPLRLNSGAGMRFLYGYLLYKAAAGDTSAIRAAIDQLEELLRVDEAYVRDHPEVYYFLARAHDAEANSDQALRYMRRFVEARLTRVEQTSSSPDVASLPEPSLEEAPITDAAGESDKERHRTRESESMELPDAAPAPEPTAANPPAGADAGAATPPRDDGAASPSRDAGAARPSRPDARATP
ncbi:MAG: hypothetical protein IT379_17315, partial [Deltaproteobacteria bacterium]|nr:hypothetical protein [Deltaproteobacteria bacterium]